METALHCGLIAKDVVALRRKLMRIGVLTMDQFVEVAKNVEGASLFDVDINVKLKSVGERWPVSKDTLLDLLAFAKACKEDGSMAGLPLCGSPAA